jgi:hypothetical protein
MSQQEITGNDTARLALVERAAAARDLDIIAAACHASAETVQIAQQASFPAMLGLETIALARRMRWLYDHLTYHGY